jgi:hypothetical protein
MKSRPISRRKRLMTTLVVKLAITRQLVIRLRWIAVLVSRVIFSSREIEMNPVV